MRVISKVLWLWLLMQFAFVSFHFSFAQNSDRYEDIEEELQEIDSYEVQTNVTDSIPEDMVFEMNKDKEMLSENTTIPRAIHVSVVGNSYGKMGNQLIQQILNFPSDELDVNKSFSLQFSQAFSLPEEHRYLFLSYIDVNSPNITLERLSIPADVSICFLDQSLMADRQDVVTARLLSALQYDELAVNTKGPKPLLIFYFGEYNDDLTKLIDDAWVLAQQSLSTNFLSVFDIKVLVLPFSLIDGNNATSIYLDQRYLTAIDNAMEKAFENASSLESFLIIARSIDFKSRKQITTGNVLHSKLNKLTKDNKVRGDVEFYKNFAMMSISKVLIKANSSLPSINKMESADEFKKYIDGLLSEALTIFENKIASSGTIEDKELEKMMKDYIIMEMGQRLRVLYTSKLELFRRKCLSEFYEKIKESIPIDIYISENLRKAAKDTKKQFNKIVNDLRPERLKKNIFWSGTASTLNLEKSLDQVVHDIETQHRVSGVLPRSNKIPIDLAFHGFLNHPLGKDYRQDVLGKDSSDKFQYLRQLPSVKKVLTSATAARKYLKNVVNSPQQSKGEVKSATAVNAVNKNPILKALTNSLSFDLGNKLKKQSEFVREMMMFPLSIKNPDVPHVGQASKKKQSPLIRDSDETRLETGPERFIRWDLPPLNEVKENIEHLCENNENSNILETIVQETLNLNPKMYAKYYKHPSYNYGKRYSPNNNSK